MVKAKKNNKGKKGQEIQVRRARGNMRVRQMVDSYENRLLKMIADPCGAELVNGLGLSTNGICQRFVQYYSPAVGADNNFYYIWNPNSQSPSSAVTFRSSLGGAAPSGFANGGSPGEAFLEANAEAVSVLGACIELLYVGKLADRRGFVGVCQAPMHVLNDIAASTSITLQTLLTYCQAVTPVTSGAIEVKWAPTMQNFTQNTGVGEASASLAGNGLMIVCIGVVPSDFTAKFTYAVEYTPKAINGIPAARVSKNIPVGVGEKIISTLGRANHWWHNVGEAMTAANRLGGTAGYALGQAARFAGTVSRALPAATTLLALTG